MRTSLLATLALVVSLSLGSCSTAYAGSSIKSDEQVVFFTTAASWQGSGWVAPIHGWIFEPEHDSIWRGALVQSVRAILRVKANQETMFRKRLGWFLVDNERRKKIKISVGGVNATLGRSGSNGHFEGSVQLSGQSKGASVTFQAKNKKGTRRFAGTILLVPEEGVSVISDIDDTIKITGAWDRQLTLRNTFLKTFEAVPDMATLYRRWKREGAVFHYVSAGPWHLFVPLTDFFNRVAFPEGTMHLKNFRLQDDSRFSLLEKPHKHKLATIKELLTRFPKRSFVLVGDAGQDDPEIYAQIAREHPAQIRAIYIRLIGPRGMPEERMQAIQADLAIPVQVFEKPAELVL